MAISVISAKKGNLSASKNKTSLILCQIAVLVILLVGFGGCAGKQETVKIKPAEPVKVFSQQEYDGLIGKGDSFFSKMHLYGWRKADEFYAKAYEMKKTGELRNKRFLTLALTAIREKHEQIVNRSTYEKIEALGEFEKTQKQQYIADLLKGYRSQGISREKIPAYQSGVKKSIDPKAFNISQSPVDLYLFIKCLNYFSIELGVYNEAAVKMLADNNVFPLIKKFKESPLFIYFNVQSIIGKEDKVLEKYPNFAEISLLKGNKLFKDSKLKAAGKYYREVLDKIPDYTKAMVGMGNIYFLTVQDYKTAISYYDSVLELDGLQPVALFGKGASLHRLSRYDESDAVFDFMLENQHHYLGEAYYYKAYNQHHQGKMDKARELIDKAKRLLPRSGEVLYLSGLLYYREKLYKKSLNDFYDCLYDRDYSPCFPLHYIGMIRMKKQNWKFLDNFRESIACFKDEEASMRRKLGRIDNMDLEPHQRAYMKQRQVKRIAEFEETAEKVIARMNLVIDKNKHKKRIHEKKKETAALKQVKKILAKFPGRINARDAKNQNQSMLHKAVINGHVQAVEYLLKERAYVDIMDSNEFPPLKWAVMLGKLEIARLLLARGADVDKQDPSGLTVLHDAAYNGNIEMVKLLLKKGARLDPVDDMGRTPLDMAIENKKKEVLPLLKPLHACAIKGDTMEMKRLLQIYKSLLDARDENGRTPLQLAAKNGHIEMVRLLLGKKARINARDTEGYTALEMAQTENREDMATLLKENGAAPPNRELIKNGIKEKEAALWYLGGHGWGIKTKNHFLVFNYRSVNTSNFRAPTLRSLANGHLNIEELKDLKITVFLGSDIYTGSRNNPIFKMQESIPGVRYVSNGKNIFGAKHFTIKANQKRTIEDMNIAAFRSTSGPGQVGFLIRVDGMVILYAGNQGYWQEDQWDSYKSEIDRLSREAEAIAGKEAVQKGIDIAFLPIPTLKSMKFYQNTSEYTKGIAYVLKQMRPKAVFPLVQETNEYDGIRVAREAKGNGLVLINGADIMAPHQRGDRYLYTGGKMQSHN